MVTLSPDQARRLLLRAVGLVAPRWPTGRAGALGVLEALTCVQLDPIDRVGTSPDLTLHARIPSARRGLWAKAMPGGGFEHFAKERCLLPAAAFPHYRDQAAQAPWWRLDERLKRLDSGVIEDVRAEIAERGPLTAGALADRGAVKPMDWSGWKGTAKASSMAVEVLWTRCQVVTAGRTAAGHRLYDVPSRALPDHHDKHPAEPFGRWALRQRVKAAGLLPLAHGPWWSMLSAVRTSDLPASLCEAGELAEVEVTGSRRRYLANPASLEGLGAEPDHDARLRVMAPLDPLLWDRKLVEQIFGFEYTWEIYKPAAQRRWGYYVCPLLHEGQLVGRLEARREAGENGAFRVVVDQLWKEAPWGKARQRALNDALDTLAAAQPPA